MTDPVELGEMPGTFFCVRCDRNRWFTNRHGCQFCGHHEHEQAAPGGLNPNVEELAAMRRRPADG